MKTFKTLLLTTIVLLSFAACDNDEPKNEEQENQITDGTYTGLLSVDQNDGTFYNKENVSVVIEINEEGTMTFIMQKVSFSEKMPITLDMTVSGVTTEKTETGLTLSGNNIIPTAMLGTPFPNYTMTDINGTITNEKLEMTMMCGTYPLSFSGTKNISN